MKTPQSPARLSICLLGQFQVALDGNPVTGFESDKARALLAYLAVESDRPLRRERLAGLFWPESPEGSARTNLRSALKNVRRVIGDRQAPVPCIEVSRQALQFSSACDAWLDVAAFSSAVASGVSDAAGAPIDPQGVDRLAQATTWYRGPFMEGFSLADSPAFEEWALLKREQLQRAALDALHRLAAHFEALGDFERGLQYARRGVDLDPWQEWAHRQLMRLLALGGNRAAALAQYEACRRALAEDLGVEPEEDTTALYQRLRAGEFSAPRPRSLALQNNLPVPLTPFIGRDRELTEVQSCLMDPVCRLVTLVAPGGSGKTHLAIQVARNMIDGSHRRAVFPHGVFFVPLITVGAPDALVPAIAQALGFAFYEEADPKQTQPSQMKPKQQLLAFLRDKRVLLVLDNFEHLLSPTSAAAAAFSTDGGAVALTTEILTAAPGVKLLVTSREGLNLHTEWRYPLAGLDFPPGGNVETAVTKRELESYSAVALFAQCARCACPSFDLEQHGNAAVRLCQLVEGMPLAIELSATWLRALTMDRIVTELEKGLNILTTTQPDFEPRHQSMRAVFDHSYGLLSEVERRVLRRLSVLNGFRLGAGDAVAGATMPLLARLVEKSMLRVLPSGRYQMHELLRQYALERLSEDPQEQREAQNRHSDFYARFAQARGEALKGHEQQTALEEMAADSENVRVAWSWAAEGRMVERLDTALEGLCLFFERRLRFREGEEACRLAAEKLAAAPETGDVRLSARLLTWQAAFCPLERAELAERLLEKSTHLLAYGESAGSDVRRERAFLLLQRGGQAFLTDLERARGLFEQSVTLYRELDDKWWTARVLEPLAWSNVYLGAYDDGMKWHRESLALRQELGDQRGIAESYRGLAVVAVRGNIDEGMQSVRKCIAIWRQLGDRAGIAGGLNQLAPGLIITGGFREAFQVLEESLGICSDLGLRWGAAWANVWRGFAELHVGEYQAARSRGEQVFRLAREYRDYEYLGRSLMLLGEVALAEAAYAEALSYLEESVASYRKYGLPNEMIWALADLAVATRSLGRSDQARAHICEALRTAIEHRAVLSLFYVVPKTALFCADGGELERAVEVYALASRCPGVDQSRWFQDVCGRHLDSIADTLPPEVVKAMQALGRTRDLETTAADLLAELEDGKR